MEGSKLIRILIVAVVMVILPCSVVYAAYHHVDSCSVCHYAGQNYSDCAASAPEQSLRSLPIRQIPRQRAWDQKVAWIPSLPATPQRLP